MSAGDFSHERDDLGEPATAQLCAVCGETVAGLLRAALGSSLLSRMQGVPQHVLAEMVLALPPGRSARSWFRSEHRALGCTPIAAVEQGRLDDVLSVLAHHP